MKVKIEKEIKPRKNMQYNKTFEKVDDANENNCRRLQVVRVKIKMK